MPKANRSGNPAVRASSAADFKKRVGGLLTLPSGLVVRVQNKGGMRAFVESGMVPNSLMTIVNEAVAAGTSPSEEEVGKLIGMDGGKINVDAVNDMLEMTNRVVMNVVVDPKIYPVPPEEAERRDDLVYIDEVSETDRMFIFQWVTGGTRDIERFRQEQVDVVGALGRRQGIQDTPQSASGNR